MTPAFSSSRQAAAFALLLALLLALPALVAHTGWLQRRDVYPAIPWYCGAFPWIQQKIFNETNDVDIAFLGSSEIFWGVSTLFVQQQLSAKLGRPAEVFTLGWCWPGFDSDYVIAADLLDHRRVRMLVIDEEHYTTDTPHLLSSRWFRMGEHSEVLDGLPWTGRAGLYGNAVLGMPRHLLSLVRPNRLEDPAYYIPNSLTLSVLYNAPNIAEQLGALRACRAFHDLPDFSPYQPPSTATASDVVIYSEATRGAFTFTGPPTPPYQRHFVQKLAQLCRARGTRLVVLHMPAYHERDQTTIQERVLWPEELDAPVAVVGIPGKKLLAGIPPDKLEKLFSNPTHLNANGQDLFTPLITPALLKLYEAAAN